MKSPFNEARYRELLEGLEATEISYQELAAGATTFRFDSEYFMKKYLAHEAHVVANPIQFTTFDGLGLTVDGSAFYPSIEPFYDEGTLPFLRVADVDSVIDFENSTTIPDELCTLYPTLQKVFAGDVVLTKGGSIGRVGLVTQEAAACRDLIFINSSQLAQADSHYLSLYLQSQFANDLLIRSGSQTAQAHLTLTLVRDLPIFWPSIALREQCTALLLASNEARAASVASYTQAEALLLDALHLTDWQPPTPLTYEQPASAAFASGRLDAEYYQPQYSALFTHLKEYAPRLRRVSEFAAFCERGALPVYDEEGSIPVFTSKHVLETGIDYDNADRTSVLNPAATAKQYDLLTYLTGSYVKKPGRTAIILEDIAAQVSGDVNILRLKEENPVYVAVVINSLIGRLQCAATCTGSIQQHLYSDDIRNLQIPFVADSIQRDIAQHVEASHTARRQAKQLLEAAKRAVETAIEEGEAAGLAYLQTISAN